jgi:CDP-diacylglycerol--glycerol-3-phosphate 3-phosphatidyltransferase
LIIPLNLPNLLTLLRICLVPLMVALIAVGEATGSLLLAAAVFGVAAVTDVADGHLARSRNLITNFGRIADPVADKLLVGSALVSLVAIDRLALWIALVIVAREVGVSLLRYHAGLQGIVIHVSSLGKAKTGAQMTAIPMLMLVPDPTAPWVGAIMLGVVAITIASGLDYALTYEREASAADTAAVPVARW